MNDLESMYPIVDEEGDYAAEIESGVHVDDLRAAVEAAGYIFTTDGRVFAIIKKNRQPIQYAKTGTV